MCYERYKGYSVCSHADPQSTPTESKLCDEFINTGVCVMGKKHVLVTSEYTPSLCPRCWELEVKLELSIGSLDDSQSGSDTWRLWCRLGWKHKDLILVVDLIYVVQMAQAEMHKWEGPRHNEQAFLKKWIEVFEGFKDWLWERLDKRDGEGRLYFPPGEEKGVRIEKKSVLRHLVSWMCEL
ncbi:hypothetical protein RRF57_003680 [Xylaria bambusicola]|uniref:Uncharacterized protein n=1 Tax=Xylaria bambusicola TaxID=326684 RepID=A0AAN7YWI6_9PEZI